VCHVLGGAEDVTGNLVSAEAAREDYGKQLKMVV
jgi:hypothetical protein